MIRPGARNVLMTGKRLPYDAEVKYLESDGGQYIDTGLVLGADDEIYCEFAVLDTRSSLVFGARDGVNLRNISCGILDSGALIADQSNGDYPRYRASLGSVQPSACSVPISRSQRVVTSGSTRIASDVSQIASFECSGTCLLFNGRGSFWSGAGGLVGRISRFRVVRNGVVRMDLRPVRLTNLEGDLEGAMYDSVSRQLLYNNGTGTFAYGDDADAYDTRLEYIQSTGDQWIVTPVRFTSGTLRVEGRIYNANSDSGESPYLGCSVSSSLRTDGVKLRLRGDNMYVDAVLAWSDVHSSTVDAADEDGFMFQYDTATSTVARRRRNGTTGNMLNQTGLDISSKNPVGTSCSDNPYVLFAHGADGTGRKPGMRVYRMRFLVDGVVVCDLVPVVLADGTVTMYDRVLKRSLAVSGSEPFVGGPEKFI